MLSSAIRRIFESKPTKTLQEEKPIEHPEVEDDNNLKNEEVENENENENENNSEENELNTNDVQEEEELTGMNKVIEDEEKTQDINIQIIDKNQEGAQGKAWIVAFDKVMTWSSPVIATKSRFQHSASSTNSSKSTLSLDESQVPYATKRLQKAIEHNKEIRNRLIKRDQILRERKEFQRLSTLQKLRLAENRRQQNLSTKSKILFETKKSVNDTNNVSKNKGTSKLMLATLSREKILKQIREKASNNVDYARSIALEKRNFDDEYATIRKDLLNQRLTNARLRRQSALNSKKLDLKQHLTYTKSVMENKKHCQELMNEHISKQLKSAEYRRNLNLDEIHAKAKHHNLMVKTKIKYANAVHETKMLEESLRSDRKHENAYGRRMEFLKASSSNEIRQSKILSNLKEIAGANATLQEKINAKLESASIRRSNFIRAKRNAPVERCLCLKARKQKNEVNKTRTLLKQIQSKVRDAEYRRLSFIESRRRKCASVNWKVKMARQRSNEEMILSCERNKNILLEKLSEAEKRRQNINQSLFALSLRDRALRLRQSILNKEKEQKKLYQEKKISTNLRQSAEFVAKLDKIIQAQNREIKAANQRETQEKMLFRKMKQELEERMLGAEERQKLQMEKKTAFARKENLRCLNTRTKSDLKVSNLRTSYEEKLRSAEERRRSYLSTIMFPAIRDQEKIKLAREKTHLELEIQKISFSEKQAKAKLRRHTKAQQLSEKARSFLERHNQRQMEKLTSAKQKIEEKQKKACKNREAYLQKKIAVARDNVEKIQKANKKLHEAREKAKLTVISNVDIAHQRRNSILQAIRERAKKHVSNVENKLKQCQVQNNESALRQRKHLEMKLENAAARREKLSSVNFCDRLEVVGHTVSIEQCTSAV